MCVSGAFILIQLYSETSAACAQGACEIVLSGRINTPEMFEKKNSPSLLVTKSSILIIGFFLLKVSPTGQGNPNQTGLALSLCCRDR